MRTELSPPKNVLELIAGAGDLDRTLVRPYWLCVGEELRAGVRPCGDCVRALLGPFVVLLFMPLTGDFPPLTGLLSGANCFLLAPAAKH
jgi:hypothetical protein